MDGSRIQASGESPSCADRYPTAQAEEPFWLGGHTTFAARRQWDFRSPGRGDIDFEQIIVALNDVGYQGPLSAEWEDSRMDREHGAAEAAAFVKKIDFKLSAIALEIVEDYRGDTYRAVYTVRFRGIVFALYASQKKSVKGRFTRNSTGVRRNESQHSCP